MSGFTPVISFIAISLATYIIVDYLIKKILEKTRSVGRPSRNFKFLVLILYFFVDFIVYNWLGTNVSNYLINNHFADIVDVVYGVLILICYYMVRIRKLL